MSVHQRVAASKKTPKTTLSWILLGYFSSFYVVFVPFYQCFSYNLCTCAQFSGLPHTPRKDAWKYCIFLLDGPTWSTGHTHYLVQKETLSASDSCKGSFLQTAFGQQIPNTQGSPELKDSKCIHRDSQPLFLRFLTQTDSTSSVSALSFI